MFDVALCVITAMSIADLLSWRVYKRCHHGCSRWIIEMVTIAWIRQSGSCRLIPNFVGCQIRTQQAWLQNV